MSNFDRDEKVLVCPQCQKEFKARNDLIYNSRQLKCSNSSCGAEIKLDSSMTSNYLNSLQELERSQEKVEKAKKEIFSRAEIKIIKK